MRELINKITDDNEILLSEIPDIDLYIDQITTLFENKMSDNKRKEAEKLLTKSMINNYSKEGVLKSIKGKKYSKPHTIMMIMLYNLKKTLSINDIKKLFSSVDNEISFDKVNYNKEKIETIYSKHLDNRESLQKIMDEFLNESEKSLDLSVGKKEDLLLMALYFSSASAYLKRYAEGIIDNYCEK